MTEHDDPPDTARNSALPASQTEMKKTPSVPPGALKDAPPWVIEILDRFDKSQETMRLHVAEVFDRLQLDLLAKIEHVDKKHTEKSEALESQVRRAEMVRTAAPMVAVALSVVAIILCLALFLKK